MSELKIQKLHSEDVAGSLDVGLGHQQGDGDFFLAHGPGQRSDGVKGADCLFVENQNGVDIALARFEIRRQTASDHRDALQVVPEDL